uniref:Uncharacterized protein n=1 Tax=Meloidogyne incognita TaxID=6306 RepID=A0A914L4M8_MELIC
MLLSSSPSSCMTIGLDRNMVSISTSLYITWIIKIIASILVPSSASIFNIWVALPTWNPSLDQGSICIPVSIVSLTSAFMTATCQFKAKNKN